MFQRLGDRVKIAHAVINDSDTAHATIFLMRRIPGMCYYQLKA
jgi:hypothetical protein